MDFFLFTETGHIKKENIGNVMFVPQVLPEHGAGPQRCQGDGGHCHYHVCQMMFFIIVMIAVLMVMVLLAMVRDMEVLVLFMIVSLVMYCMSLFGSMSKSWL